MKAKHKELNLEMIALHIHDLIQRLKAIITLRLKNGKGNFSPPPGLEPWPSGIKSHCASNEQHWTQFLDYVLKKM